MSDSTNMATLKDSNSKECSSTELEKYLRAIVDALGAFQPAEDELMNIYPEWRKRRGESILVLNQLADGLDKHKSNCNISKAVGTSVGIVGGIAAITGSVLLVASTSGLAAIPLMAAAGGAAGALGGFTVAGTVVAEIVIEKQDLEKAKNVLQKDKTESEELFKWMKRTEELERAVEKIMSFKTFNKLLNGFRRIYEEVSAIRDITPTNVLPIEIKNFLNELRVPQLQKLKLIELFIAIFQSQECLNLFKTIIDMYLKVRLIFQRSFSVISLLVKGFRLLDASVDTGKAVVNFTRGATAVSRTTVPLIAFGIFSAVSVAVDIVTLFLTSKNIIEGSKSELAAKIRDCATKMQDELDVLQKVYDSIFSEYNSLDQQNFNSNSIDCETGESSDIESIKLEFGENI